MTNSDKRDWTIIKDGVLIGTAFYRDVDQPFYICDFVPTPEFETYKPLFDQYAQMVNNPNVSATAEEIADFYADHIESLNLELVSFGDVWWKGEVVVIQIYDGTEAWLRPI